MPHRSCAIREEADKINPSQFQSNERHSVSTQNSKSCVTIKYQARSRALSACLHRLSYFELSVGVPTRPYVQLYL